MNKLTFPLLGALSSTEITEDGEAEKKLNALRLLIENKLEPALRETSYIAKSRLKLALERSVNDARTLCNFPQLLGKPLIGIVPASDWAKQALDCLGRDGAGVWSEISTLPLLLTDSVNQRVNVISSLGKLVNLGELPDHPADAPYDLTEEELRALIDLARDGIDPRSLCRSLHCHAPLKRPDMAFLILPPDEFGQPDSGKLLAQCDAIIILGQLNNSKSLQVLRDNFNMPVYFLTTSDASNEIKDLRSRYAGRVVEQLPPGDFEKLISNLDAHVERVTLKDRLLAEFLDVEEEITLNIAKRKDLLKSIKRDNTLFTGSDQGLDELLEATQKEMAHNIQALEQQKNKFSLAADEVLIEAKAVEAILHSLEHSHPAHKPLRLCAGVMRPGSLWRRIILRSLVAGHLEQARDYQARFEKIHPEQAFLTSLYLGQPSGEQLERLRHLPDSPEALRAKIFFRKGLGLNDSDCIKIAALLPRPKSPDEKYYWALQQYELYQAGKKTGSSDAPKFEAVIEAFREAGLAGSAEAADTFARYCAGERWHEEARELADMGNPIAAWISRLLALSRKDNEQAVLYMKLAASLGYPDAIVAVANDIWSKRFAGAPGFSFAEGALTGLDKEISKAGLGVYKILKEKYASKIPDINDRLAYFYFCNRQWRESRELLGNNPVTTEGNFCRAIMLKYGHGGNLDRKEAIASILAAIEGSGPFSGFASQIRDKWYADEIAKI